MVAPRAPAAVALGALGAAASLVAAPPFPIGMIRVSGQITRSGVLWRRAMRRRLRAGAGEQSEGSILQRRRVALPQPSYWTAASGSVGSIRSGTVAPSCMAMCVRARNNGDGSLTPLARHVAVGERGEIGVLLALLRACRSRACLHTPSTLLNQSRGSMERSTPLETMYRYCARVWACLRGMRLLCAGVTPLMCVPWDLGSVLEKIEPRTPVAQACPTALTPRRMPVVRP